MGTTTAFRARILVQVTIYRRLLIGRDGLSRPIKSLRYIVTCTRIRAQANWLRANKYDAGFVKCSISIHFEQWVLNLSDKKDM